MTAEEGDKGGNPQEHHKEKEATAHNSTKHGDERGEASGQEENGKKKAMTDGQRRSKTWGKQQAQSEAALDIEKGTRKVKTDEGTEETAGAAAVRHGSVGTGNTGNTTGGISSGSESAPTDSSDAGVGGTRRGGAKRRGDFPYVCVMQCDLYLFHRSHGYVGCYRHLQENWCSQAAGLSYFSCIPLPCSNSCVSSYLGANALNGITHALIRLLEFTSCELASISLFPYVCVMRCDLCLF
jgi:hypothetical protein